MPQLHAGLATVDITPPLGSAMAGYSRVKGAESVEHPLSAQALVMESGGECVAIVAADILWVTLEIARNVRQIVESRIDLPGDSIMIAPSHTHWGPEVRRVNHLPKFLQECMFPEYLQSLRESLAEAVVQAWRNLQPVCAGWGIGVASGISFSRRPVDVHGQCQNRFSLPPQQAVIAAAEGQELREGWIKGGERGPRLSPPLEEMQGLCAGVSDPDLILLRLETPEGKPFAGLINFACHSVVGADDAYAIHPDYALEARNTFEAVVGAPMLFSLGCAGDQVPTWRKGNSRARVGRSCGAAAALTWYQIEQCQCEVPIATARREVTLARKPVMTVAEAQAALDACEDPDGKPFGQQRKHLAWAKEYADVEGLPTEMSAVRIGEFAAVGLPGEVLVEIGLQIKQRSPFSVTAPISLCNDGVGYISTAQAHREGGAEPESSLPAPEAEQQVVDTALELLNSLA